jgi:hypothetical protein
MFLMCLTQHYAVELRESNIELSSALIVTGFLRMKRHLGFVVQPVRRSVLASSRSSLFGSVSMRTVVVKESAQLANSVYSRWLLWCIYCGWMDELNCLE